MHVSDLDYDLPKELIAQHPAAKRDESRLLVLDRETGEIEHRVFREIVDYYNEGDILMLNNTQVMPAKLIGRRKTGGKIDALLVREVRTGLWESMITPIKRLNVDEPLSFEEGSISAVFRGKDKRSLPLLEFNDPESLPAKLRQCGRAPLPPYIKREKGDDEYRSDDISRYQTVYAENPGAIAAPTAGLHYTPQILDALRGKGVTIETVTLHVGPGTFKPIKADSVEEHAVDPEIYQVQPGLPERLSAAREEGRRIVGVGTTTCRVLETLARMPKDEWKLTGETGLYIYPPFEFKWVDALQTNFHVPRSSLLALVFAFAGRDRVLAAYEQAVENRYRFYSYGDAMLII